MLIQARVLSIARVCVIYLYIVLLAGTWAVGYSASEHMASFYIVRRWERTVYCMMNVTSMEPGGLCCINKPARQMAHLK